MTEIELDSYSDLWEFPALLEKYWQAVLKERSIADILDECAKVVSTDTIPPAAIGYCCDGREVCKMVEAFCTEHGIRQSDLQDNHWATIFKLSCSLQSRFNKWEMY